MIERIHYDWSKKFEYMKFDTGSKLKSFFRGDWRKSDIDAKKQFNNDVDIMINRLYNIESKYNILVVEYKDYSDKYNETIKNLREKDKSPGYLNSKVANVQNRYSVIKNEADKIEKSLNSIPVYKKDINILHSNTGTIKNDIDKLKNKIIPLYYIILNAPNEIRNLKLEIEKLNGCIQETNRKLSDIKCTATSSSIQKPPPDASENLSRLLVEENKKRDELRKKYNDVCHRLRNRQQELDRAPEELTRIVDEIHSFNENKINIHFKSIKDWANGMKNKMKEITKLIKDLRIELKMHIDNKYNIITSKSLESINKKLENACSKFNIIFKKMQDRTDYSITLNGSKEILRKINIEIDELENLRKIIYMAFEGTKKDFDRFKNAKSINDSDAKLTNEKINYINQIMDNFQEQLKINYGYFINDFRAITPPIIIKPIYDDKIKCIKDVREGTISMPKV